MKFDEILAVLQQLLKSKFRLSDDSVIKSSLGWFAGGKTLSIDPGGSADYLETGDEIGFTQGTVDLTELVGKAIYNFGSGCGAKSD